MILFSVTAGFPVHAIGESYSLNQSTTRIQETDNPGITFSLNVTGATASLNYQFTWTVRDPTGGTKTANTNVNTAPTKFVTSVTYPTSFGTSVTLVGNYTLTVTQASPPPSTSPAATAQFKVGLTDALVYQRTNTVSIMAQGYRPLENITIVIRSGTTSATGFPTSKLANSAGILSFTWAPPYNTPLGNFTGTLTGVTTTNGALDTQSFDIDPASVNIPQVSITQTLLQRSQVESFRFVASYPNSLQARTGSAIIRVTEADGTTIHNITATYKTSLGLFEGSYRIPLNSTTGAWVASIDIGGFNDGYGNTGPVSGVVHGFAVSPASLIVSPSTSSNNYTIGNVVAIYVSVITPGGANFTSGAVSATTFFSGQRIGGPVQLFYDLSRGKWVGGYTINTTSPSGVWLVEINATDLYGNTGYGSTSILVTVSAPQQASTFNYLLVVIIILVGALAILGSWVVLRRGRISRRVLKVDLEAVHAEAQKVENQDFFKKIKEQLSDQRSENQSSPDSK